MNVADLTAAIERGYNIGPDGNSALCAGGEAFVVFCASGYVHSNDIDDVLSDTLQAMIGRHFGGRGGEHPVLYWRRRPEFATKKVGENERRSVYCRLFIGPRVNK